MKGIKGSLDCLQVQLGLQSKMVVASGELQAFELEIGAQTGEELVALGGLCAGRRLL